MKSGYSAAVNVGLAFGRQNPYPMKTNPVPDFENFKEEKMVIRRKYFDSFGPWVVSLLMTAALLLPACTNHTPTMSSAVTANSTATVAATSTVPVNTKSALINNASSQVVACGVQYVTGVNGLHPGTTATFAVNYNPGLTTNTLLVVQVWDTNNASGLTATDNGVAMNAYNDLGAGCPPGGHLRTFVYVNPPASNTVTVNASATGLIYYGAMIYQGVNQAAPIGATYQGIPCNSSKTQSYSIGTVGVNSLISSMIVVTGTPAITSGTGQTQRYTETDGVDYTMVGDDLQAPTNGSYTLSYSLSSSQYAMFQAVEIEAASCATPTATSTFTSTFTSTPTLTSTNTPTFTSTSTNTPVISTPTATSTCGVRFVTEVNGRTSGLGANFSINASGTNTLLVVQVWDNLNAVNITGTDNGNSMLQYNNTGYGCAPGGYLNTLVYVNPPAGVNTINLTVSPNGAAGAIYYAAMIYQGVNQASPIGATYQGIPCQSSNTQSYNIGTVSTNSLICSMILSAGTPVITSGAGQTQRYTQQDWYTMVGDEKTTSNPGSYTMSFALSVSQAVEFQAVEIEAASCQ